MEEISTFIDILERAGINYEVDQSADEDGLRTLQVFVYDERFKRDGKEPFAVFEFDAYNEPDLMSFMIIK